MNKQEWISGSIVRVGFLGLRVVRQIQERTDKQMPRAWELESVDGSRVYHFVPHNGLTRVS